MSASNQTGSTNENSTLRYTITINGQTLSQQESNGVESIDVKEHIDHISECTLLIGNDSSMAWNSFTEGATLTVKVGGSDSAIFNGLVVHVRNLGNTLAVLAKDPLVKMLRKHNTATYDNQQDSAIAQSLISGAGCTPGTVDSTSGTSTRVLQRNEPNLTMLTRLAARNGYIVRATPTDGKIDFIKPSYNGTPVEKSPQDVIDMHFHTSTAHLPTKLTVHGLDESHNEVTGEATSSDIETIGSGQNVMETVGAIGQGEEHIHDVQCTSQDTAKAMAVAHLNRLARNYLQGQATIQGDGTIRSTGLIKFTGQRTGHNLTAFIIESHHTLEHGRYHTQIKFVSNTVPT